MAIEGSLDLFRLPEILQVISQETKTGILTVQGEKDIIAISFSDGRVVAADALNQTLEEALGETLEREGLLNRASYESAIAEQRDAGGRLIDVLVDRGYLDRSELLTGLRRHTSDLLAGVLSWDEGDFKFYTNDEVSYEEGFEPISVETLLLQHLPEDEEPEEVAPESPAAEPEPSSEEALPALDAVTSEMPTREPRPTPEAAAPAVSGPAPQPQAPRTPVEPAPAAPAPRPAPSRPPLREPARPTGIAKAREAGRPLWWPRLLGAAVAVGVLLAFAYLPSSHVLMPLPGSGPSRVALEQSQRDARIDHLTRAVETYYLLEGRLPERLEQLSPDLLSMDVSTVGDGAWRYEPGVDAFELSIEDASVERPLRGDFLFDPEFLLNAERLAEPPLVLLD